MVAAFLSRHFSNGAPEGEFWFTNAFGAIGQTLGAAMRAAAAVDTGRHRRRRWRPGARRRCISKESAAPWPFCCWTSTAIVDDDEATALQRTMRAPWPAQRQRDLRRSLNASVGQALGVPGVRVESMDELPEALGRATTAPGPFLVDVAISRDVITDHYRRLHFGGPNEAPHLTGPRVVD